MTSEAKELLGGLALLSLIAACFLGAAYAKGRADGIREADARWIHTACDLGLYPKSSCTEAALERCRERGVPW